MQRAIHTSQLPVVLEALAQRRQICPVVPFQICPVVPLKLF